MCSIKLALQREKILAKQFDIGICVH